MSEATALDDHPVTIAAFEAFLEWQRDARPWELVAGRIVGMTNLSERHEQIVANVGVVLHIALADRACHVYFGGLRIQRSGSARGIDRPRPDLLVRCGPVSDNTFVTDPLVVVEVLSPSTIDTDRGEKLRFYKTLPTLVHIALVYQDQQRAEHYRRMDTGWELEVLTSPDNALVFEAIGAAVTLAEVYAGVTPGPG
jgi:Uma2 family endonuclease